MKINIDNYIGDLADKTVSAGRPQKFINHDEIYQDIKIKLDLSGSQSFLDVGCGYGHLTDLFIDYIGKNKLESTFIDNDNIINKLVEENKTKNIQFLSGLFGVNDFDHIGKFDRILCYSVLHYTSNPELFVDLLVQHLNSYGILMIGDIPNISQKARFISSQKGRLFDQEYKTLNNIPFIPFENSRDFLDSCNNEQKLIDDNLFSIIHKKYTSMNYDVYLLPQFNKHLPFNNTRVDLVIRKYD